MKGLIGTLTGIAAICAVVFVLGFCWGAGLVAAGATPGVVVNVEQKHDAP